MSFLRGAALGRLGAALDDEEVAAFDLGHDSRERLVDQWVEGRVADEVVCNVDLQTFVLGDWRREGVYEICKGWKGTGS